MFEKMFNELKSSAKQVLSSIEERFKIPEPDGAFQLICGFGIADKPLTQGCVSVDQDSWRIEAYDEREQRKVSSQDSFADSFEDFTKQGNSTNQQPVRVVRLFEVAEPENQECVLACRAHIKTVDIKEGANLRLGFNRQIDVLGIKSDCTTFQSATVSGTTDWKVYEVRYHFKKEQYSGTIWVNIEFQSSGILWIKDVELLQAPVKAAV